MTIAAGTKLGRYEIRSQIGAGGMGEVYLAQDTKLDRKVALKILPADVAAHQDRMRRFVQEAKAASALNHPNIITIYEIDEWGSSPAPSSSGPGSPAAPRRWGGGEQPGWSDALFELRLHCRLTASSERSQNTIICLQGDWYSRISPLTLVVTMSQYDLHLLCRYCGNFHDLFVRVTLDESFEVRSAKDAYQGEVPPELQAFVGQTCPITGEPIEKPMIDGLVLVAAGRRPSHGEQRP